MMSELAHRRVVTGLNEAGESCILIDGAVPSSTTMGGIAWRTDSHPADNSVQADFEPAEFSFDLMHSSTIFMVNEYPPGLGADGELFWHATDTIDYIVILEGEVVLVTETGCETLSSYPFEAELL